MSEEPPSPSVEIAVVIQDPAWREILPGAAEMADSAARAALRQGEIAVMGLAAPSPRRVGAPAVAELTVVLADDRLAQRLNRDYRRQDEPTNVLSFAGLDGPPEADPALPRLLGDVVLARETILKEADEQSKVLGDHFSHLVVHGVLHLLGFDHETKGRAEVMESLERAVLAGLGIADPYRDHIETEQPRLGFGHD